MEPTKVPVTSLAIHCVSGHRRIEISRLGAATRAIHAFGEGNYRPAELPGSIRNREPLRPQPCAARSA